MNSSSTSGTEVLIIGAGPTGLVLALWLARLGCRVRIVDKTSEPGTTSRALAVQARTLELYSQIGIAQAVVERGRKTIAGNFWVGGEKAAHFVLGEMGSGLSPFPFALVFPQDEHERLLIECLREAGVEVERETELAGLEEAGGQVVARLKGRDGGQQTCEAAYIAGCDGARSSVREALGIGFPGGTYSRLFYVADVQASGAVMNGELNVVLDRTDFLAVFPLKSDGHARLIGTIRDQTPPQGDKLSWSDVSKHVLERIRIDIESVNWFSTYRVHHRVADHFRRGRAFLLGDAAHIHSPVGGQGMNTGIGDAVNLAWKLAAVLGGRANPALLDSYEAERIPFARSLVRTTDRVFETVVGRGVFSRLIRSVFAPFILPLALRFAAARRAQFRLVSQTRIAYRDSPLSDGSAGEVQAGDRLPWVQGSDNFGPLKSLDWQFHVYGRVPAAIREFATCIKLSLHEWPWTPETRRAGLERDALYLVRPDGHIGFARCEPDVPALREYVNRVGIAGLMGSAAYGTDHAT
jgi:2-polyprenyl-6-methoxyphenol hydroxylase-like FAD-dependent oxidoreductase